MSIYQPSYNACQITIYLALACMCRYIKQKRRCSLSISHIHSIIYSLRKVTNVVVLFIREGVVRCQVLAAYNLNVLSSRNFFVFSLRAKSLAVFPICKNKSYTSHKIIKISHKIIKILIKKDLIVVVKTGTTAIIHIYNIHTYMHPASDS